MPVPYIMRVVTSLPCLLVSEQLLVRWIWTLWFFLATGEGKDQLPTLRRTWLSWCW